MKDAVKLGLVLAAGIAIGAIGVPALKAQPAAHAAYVVAELHVTDPAGFTQYVKALPATLAPYHAKTLARGLPDTREGTPPDGDVVILGFDSLKAANEWYQSAAYQAIVPLRQKSATSRVYLVDGAAR